MTKFNFKQAREQYNELMNDGSDAAESKAAMIAYKIQCKQYNKLLPVCIRNLKCPDGENLFRYAARYAWVAVEEVITTYDDHYELTGFETKTGNPVVVEF